MNTSAALVGWWNEMTNFPITANVELKGLVKPTLLMTKVRLNVLFFGQKHIYSGLYLITKEQMVIDSRGYKTTLTLLRVGGDDTYNQIMQTGVNNTLTISGGTWNDNKDISTISRYA